MERYVGKHQKEPGHQTRDTASPVDNVRSPDARASHPARSGGLQWTRVDPAILLKSGRPEVSRYRPPACTSALPPKCQLGTTASTATGDPKCSHARPRTRNIIGLLQPRLLRPN